MNRYFILSLLLVSSFVFGSGYLIPNGAGVKINKITMHGNGGATLWVSGLSNPDNCGDVKLAHLKGDLPGHSNMVSTALTAYASGKKIGLWSTGCEIIPFWGGTVTRPIIHTLWITE